MVRGGEDGCEGGEGGVTAAWLDPPCSYTTAGGLRVCKSLADLPPWGQCARTHLSLSPGTSPRPDQRPR